ncbi:MAG: T9SS C-terminal target domain-containing protein [Candidatus Kapaibacterium sp.]|nr:MAG: T9SS C-terminal target domain-containing protein [Candidatus Kapabacteria bacterium]
MIFSFFIFFLVFLKKIMRILERSHALSRLHNDKYRCLKPLHKASKHTHVLLLCCACLLLLNSSIGAPSLRAATYFYQSSDPSNPANWNTVLTGGGTAAPNFFSATDVFVFPAGRTATLGAGWFIGANVTLELQTNATINLGGQTASFDGPLILNGSWGGTLASNMFVNAAGTISGALRFAAGTEELNTLQLNRTGGFLDLGTNLRLLTLSTLAGTLRVTTGTTTLTINNTGGTNSGSIAIGATNTLLLTGGNFTLNNTGSISVANGGTVRCEGNASISGTANSTTYAGANARFVYVGSNVARALTTAEVPATMLGSVELNNPNGTVSMSGALTLQATLRLASKLDIGSFTLILNGPVDMTTDAAFSDDANGGGRITIGGANTNALSGNFRWNSAFALNGLTMDRPAQTLVLGTDVPFSNTGILSLQQGNIRAAGNFRLTLNNLTGLVGGSVRSFVQCALRRRIPSSATIAFPVTFPVGKGGVYYPLSINDATTGAGAPMLEVEAYNTITTSTVSAGIQSLEPYFWRIDQGTVGDYTRARITTERVEPPFVGTNQFAIANSVQNAPYQLLGAQLISTFLSSDFFTVTGLNPRFFAVSNSAPVPTIARVEPNTGTMGTTATITGSNLTQVRQVFFGTIPATSFQEISPSQIRAVVGAGATGLVSVVALGGTAFSPTTFAYAPAPVITGVTPTQGGNNTLVTIRGRYIASAATVSIGGVLLPVLRRTDSLLQVRCPNQDITGAIRIGTAGGVATTTSSFAWYGVPSISLFTPNAGPVRGIVRITGANLSVVDTVFVGGVRVESYTVNSSTTVSIVLGRGTTGTITIVTPAGRATSATIFFFTPPPIFNAVTDERGAPITEAVGGTTVLLTGDHFIYATRATFGALTGANLQVISQTQASVQVPIGVTNALVRLETPGGIAISRTNFEVQPFVSITGFSPSFGTSGTVVEITGRNFSTDAIVTIVGVPAREVRVLSTTQILAVVGTIPPRAVRGSVIVTTANGTFTSTASFLVAAAQPLITGIEPTRATFGSLVNVRGQFLTGVREVTIGGGRAELVQSVSSTELIVRITRTTTTGTLGLSTIGGATTSSIIVTVIPAPYLTSVQPPFTVTGGTLTLRGGNLTNISSVIFGTTPALNFFVQSDSVIIAQLGSGSSGFVRVSGSRGSAQSPQELQVLTQLEFETAIVRTLYDSLGGASWTNRATNRWLSADPVRDWAGITVENNRITQIRLPENNLRGTIPEALAELQGLRVLDLTDNALAGAFPAWIQRLTSLEEVRVGGNQLTGSIPDSIGALSRLRVLVADRNRLTGRIPAVLCGLSSIEEVNLRQNGFTGEIPSCLGLLSRLRSLTLGENRLTGAIPSELTNVTNLQALYLDRNELTGEIPSGFGTNLTTATAQTTLPKDQQTRAFATPSLRFLWLNGNRLTGDVPVSIGSLGNIEELRLDNNQLRGSNLSGIIPRLTNLQTLDVGRNQLSGTVPSGIGNLRRLKFLALRNNQFTGEIPQGLATLDSLQTIFLDSNSFSGTLPAQFRQARSLQTLGLSFNRFTSIPGFTSPSIVSTLFAQGNRLQFGDLQNNAFIPNFIYAPQDSVGAARDTSVVIGNPFEISIAVTGRANQYQWFRNGVEVRQTSATVAFRLESFTARDTGSYVCVITNTIMDRLRLVSRPVRVLPVPPRPPTQAPELVFPQQDAKFIAFAPTLQWTRVDNAVEYLIHIAERRDFAEILTTATVRFADTTQRVVTGMVSGLQPLVQYYWRVQAINGIGITSPWSLAGRFSTAPPGTAISMSSVNFGNVVLGESSIGRAFLTNLTRDDLLLRDVDGNDNEISFRIPLDIRGLTLRAGQTILLDSLRFAPRSIGEKQANVSIRYINALGREDTLRLADILQGRGTPVKVLPINMDTIRFGKTAQSIALLLNRGDNATRMSVTGVEFVNKATGFSVEQLSAQRPLYVGGSDTTAVIIRCNPISTGNFTNTLRYFVDVERLATNGTILLDPPPFKDTLSAPLTVFVREQRPQTSVNLGDVSMRVGVRPARGLDSVAPGGRTTLELYFLDSTQARDIIRLNEVNGLPLAFSASLRMSSQVLSLVPNAAAYTVRNLDTRSRTHRVSIPYFPLARVGDQTLVEEFRRTGVFLRITCASVSGDVDTSAIELEDVRWGIDSLRRYVGTKQAFLEEVRNGLFRAQACQAGGKRLTTTAKANRLTALAPNPAHDAAALKYTVREDGFVEISLVNVLGNVVKTLVQSEHQAGEYALSVPLQDIPSGTYFLVMTAPNAVLTERVTVRH